MTNLKSKQPIITVYYDDQCPLCTREINFYKSKIDPNSAYYQQNKIKEIKKMVLYCALGFRSALATKSLVDMGFKNVAHVDGGFDALKGAGLKVIDKEKK